MEESDKVVTYPDILRSVR